MDVDSYLGVYLFVGAVCMQAMYGIFEVRENIVFYCP